MRSFPKKAGALALLAVVSLYACGGGGDDDDDDQPPEFSQFVLGLFDQTADDTQPVKVNGKDFTFDKDPDAYDELFQ